MTIKALCLTQDPDRPTTATFIGLRDAGVDISVVCPGYDEAAATLRAAGVPVLDLPIGGRFDRGAVRALREELLRGGYDILHLFSNKALESGLQASKGLPIRIVAYRGIVGNVSFFDPVSWMRFLNPRIDRIVCVAESIRAYFLQMRPKFLRMPEHRPVTIHKGHDLDWYRAAPADLTVIGIPGDAFVVVCVANYRPRKGIEFLVDAMALLPPDWHAHLLLVGDMVAKRLDARIAASPIAERIHRVGHRRDAAQLSAAADVFVLPSIKREGLSRSLIEAMAYQVPPIVTDCGGSPELVENEISGFVVPTESAHAIADAIGRYFNDPAMREAVGRAARTRIEHDFRIEETIAKTLALYRELVGAQ